MGKNFYLETQIRYLNSIINIQKTQKNTIVNYMQKFASSTSNTDFTNSNQIKQFLEELKKYLSIINSNLNITYNMLNSLNNIKDNLLNDISDNFYYNNDIILSVISKKIADAEEFLHNSFTKYCSFKFPIKTIEDIFENSDIKKENNAHSDNIQTNINNTISIDEINKNGYPPENTLFISEKKGLVYLPYTAEDLKKKESLYPELSKDKVIKKFYSRSLKTYKNSSIARFKEAFLLVKNKENGSIIDAFDLGMELFANYNLHPAIISACKNLVELDIYLDYLECGELNKFDCFNIIFDIAPILKK